RAIYLDGWLAGTVHRVPWEPSARATLQNDVWELYDTRTDFSLMNDLAARNPAKLKELQDLFMKESAKNHARPIDDRGIERVNAALAGRPDLMAGWTNVARALRGNVWLVGERLYQREEPLAHDHRVTRDS